MRSVNRVTLLGNLGRDAETKFTTGGTAKTTFSIATTRKWKQGEEWKEQTDWHNIVLWRSEKVAEYLLKGKPVYVEGRIETRSYDKDGEKKYVTEIVAENVILLGGERGEDRPVSAPRSAKRDDFGGQGVTDEDVPF